MAALLLLALAAVQGARAQLNQAAYLPLQSDGDTPVAPGNSFYGTVSLILCSDVLTPTTESPAQCS